MNKKSISYKSFGYALQYKIFKKEKIGGIMIWEALTYLK